MSKSNGCHALCRSWHQASYSVFTKMVDKNYHEMAVEGYREQEEDIIKDSGMK